ncbi:hypothetical protein [Paraburkholderia dinghuensis]|uniref:Uncharacterized protein n=1 Tax=Paraburkholderia dinghuensis TaxID=2305225 RepID=A0A3N6PWA0_9BURK|nr:hypothetical protein [Paraburkholderia dinghuensis]RQH06620.1 hypothetical protein D1Y85_12165 [Paraburkholderia dinghuensis]
MLFMPVDLFKPWVQGQQQAVKDNWDDLFNSEKLRQDYVKTNEAEGTEGSDIFATNARNQYLGDTANRQDVLGAAAQPGKLATTQLTSDTQQAAAQSLQDQGYPAQYGSTMGARAMSNLAMTGLGTTEQNAAISALTPQAQNLGTMAGQDIINTAKYKNQAGAFQLAQQPVMQQAQAAVNTGNAQLIPQRVQLESATNADQLANAQSLRRAQLLQQNATQVANLMSFRGDSSTPDNALALQQHTDSTNAWLRGQGLLDANQQVVYPPGQEPVINTYNPNGSILSTVPAVPTFDRWAAYTSPAASASTRTGSRGAKTTAPVANPLVGGGDGGGIIGGAGGGMGGSAGGPAPRAPGTSLPTGSDWRRGQQQPGTTPNPLAPPGSPGTTNQPGTPSVPVTQDQVDQARTALDTLNRRKLVLFQQYPGLQNASLGFHRLDMPFEGGGEADVPAPAIKALAKLDSDITAAKQGYDLMRQRFGMAEQARQAAADNQAAEDILRNLK